MVILSVDDWVCIFVLFVVWIGCPAQGTTGGWGHLVLYSSAFLSEFSQFDTP